LGPRPQGPGDAPPPRPRDRPRPPGQVAPPRRQPRRAPAHEPDPLAALPEGPRPQPLADEVVSLPPIGGEGRVRGQALAAHPACSITSEKPPVSATTAVAPRPPTCRRSAASS